MALLAGPGLGRLRLWMAAFFLALAVPTAVLVVHAYKQLKWEAFHQHRVLAQALAARIDGELARLLDAEEARAFADYAFLVVAGDPAANFLQRSPLSAFPPRSPVPGLVGHFQVDDQGRFSTPLLPEADASAPRYGVDAAERGRRVALVERIRGILSDNRLVEGRPLRRADPSPSPGVAAQLGSGTRSLRPGAAAPPPPAAPASAQEPGTPVAPQAVMSPEDTAAAVSAMQAPADAVAGAGARRRQRAESEAKAVPEAPAPVQAQAAFDRLTVAPSSAPAKKSRTAGRLGRVEDLELLSKFYDHKDTAVPERALRDDAPASRKRAGRTERSLLPEAEAPARAGERPRIRTFESELDPFEFSLLDSGHFVLFRKVWRDGRRFIQGAVLEQRPFLDGVVGRAYETSALTTTSNLAAAWDGALLWAVGAARERYPLASAEDLAGELLHRERLSAPFSDLELVFTVARLPAGPGAGVLAWVAGVIAVVLCGGLFLMYRLGARQLDLARQQQDFVAAVSHELRTPLTSIRMYAEMLKAGWADAAKTRSYYQYIFDESERLSRLIANVLQLARMTRNEFVVDTRVVPVAALLDGIASKVTSQVERAGFELDLDVDPAVRAADVVVDEDAFHQIVINLVDNALKFSAAAAVKRVELRCRADGDDRVAFQVRDHGPGVPRDQMKKIFRLFYRSRGELTRETVGTGIGLALASELARAMDARVDVGNVEPGAVFTVSVVRATDGAPARSRTASARG